MIIDKNTLLKPLSAISSISEHRTNLPIMNNCLIEFNGSFSIFATNLEVSATIETPYNHSGESQKICIPTKMFLEYLKSLNDGDVELTLEVNVLKVQQGRTKAEFSLSEADMYPVESQKVDEDEKKIEFTVKSDIIKSLIKKVAFAIATDGARGQAVTGAYLELSNGKIKMAGTDGFRLAVIEYSDPSLNTVDTSSIIIPRRGLSEIARLANEEIKITAGRGSVTVVSGNTTLVSKLVDGIYPDVDNVIPEYQEGATIGREALLRSLEQVSTASEKGAVKISFDDKSMKVEAEGGIGNIETIVDAEYTGEPITLLFNQRYLTDALSHLEEETIVLALPTNGYGAVMIREVKDTTVYTNVIMPIRG